MKITLMLSESCSHKDTARQLLNEALEETGAEAEIEEIVVRTDEDAKNANVIGSPTIRIEGVDIEYADREPDESSNGCRYYNTPAGWKPVPEKGMIVRALERASARR